MSDNRKIRRKGNVSDRWIGDIGCIRKHMPHDPSCLFRIVAENVYDSQKFHRRVRTECCDYFAANSAYFYSLKRDVPLEVYIDELADPATYGGFLEIQAMSHIYKRDFIILQGPGGLKTEIAHNYGNPIYVLITQGYNHFDAIYPKGAIKTIAVHQSIAYEWLYEGVIKMPFVKKEVVKKEVDSAATDNTESQETNGNEDVKDEETSDAVEPKQEESQIKKEPDEKKAKDTKNNDKVWRRWSGSTLQVGIKCLYLQPGPEHKAYPCYVQRLEEEGEGGCLVFLEGLGEMRAVQRSQLQPLPRRHHTQLTISQIMRQLDYLKENNRRTYKTKQFYNKALKEEASTDSSVRGTSASSSVWTGDSAPASLLGGGDIEEDPPCLDHYTTLSYAHFQPPPMEIIAMPMINEQVQPQLPPQTGNTGSGEAGNSGDSGNTVANPARQISSPYLPPDSATPEQYPTQTTPYSEGYPQAVYLPEPTSPVPMSVGQHSMGYPMQASMSLPYGVYCLPPSPLLPPPRAPAPLLPPPHINCAVQRSTALNGTDLPMHDIPTLRYFFNLGVEWMHIAGVCYPPPHTSYLLPSNPSANGSANNMPSLVSAYSTPRITPNQLAAELQNNLSLEDYSSKSSDSKNSSPPNSNGNQGNKPFVPRENNGNRYGDNKNMRGGHHQGNRSYRRNDAQDHNNQRNNGGYGQNNFYRNQQGYNNRNNNCQRKNNASEQNGRDNNQSQEGNNSYAPNVPILSFPPPPAYPRFPYYPVENDGSGMTPAYPGPYYSFPTYGTPPEESGSGSGNVSYLSTPPPYFYPTVPYNPATSYQSYVPNPMSVPPPELPPKTN